ncbi:RHS repeat domain-containing protein [Streptomyces sp. XM83C]|uniref:RHS repeat domain-containing protein n=1 Tax=Streptomyces sp. XM83C TaxID=2929781 RepID=UPI0027E44C77|nr:RHS repeat-associated core domain-containing protein [Streptomyces sp. XM83C]
MRRLVPGLSTSQEEIDARFFAIVSDLSGAPCELIDESGDVAWRARATDWGKLSSSVRSHACTPLRFPGQYFDAGTGLHHNYLRYYDPEIGRYLSMDPLGLAPAADPVGHVDRPSVSCGPLRLSPQKTPIPVESFETTDISRLAPRFNPEKGMTDCTYVAEAFDQYLAGEGIKPVPGPATSPCNPSIDRRTCTSASSRTPASDKWSITSGIPVMEQREVWWPRMRCVDGSARTAGSRFSTPGKDRRRRGTSTASRSRP